MNECGLLELTKFRIHLHRDKRHGRKVPALKQRFFRPICF